MPIAVECECGKSYRLGDRHAGRTLRCKACGAAIDVPSADLEDLGDVLADVEDFAEAAPESPQPKARTTGRRSGRKSPSAVLPAAGIRRSIIIGGCLFAYLALLLLFGLISSSSTRDFLLNVPAALHVLVGVLAVGLAFATYGRLELRKSKGNAKSSATLSLCSCGLPLSSRKLRLGDYEMLRVEEGLDFLGLFVHVITILGATVLYFFMRVGISQGILPMALGAAAAIGVVLQMADAASGAKFHIKLSAFRKEPILLARGLRSEQVNNFIGVLNGYKKFEVSRIGLYLPEDVEAG